MTETKGKKALSLCILRVLEQHATKEAPLTTRSIIALLLEKYGMVAERKAVGRNLLLLAEMGFPLSTYQENGKGYYLKRTETEPLTDRDDPVLLDALLRAPISEAAVEYIERLQSDIPIFSVRESNQTLDDSLLDTLDLLRTAIREKHQVSFRYNTVQTDGSLSALRELPFSVSPYALFLAEGRYNVIVSMSGYGKLLHYRCDLLCDLTLLNAPAREVTELQECENGLDVVGYVNRAVYRQNTATTYTLLCARHLAGDLYDTFHRDAVLTPEGDMVRAEVRAPWMQVRKFLLQHLKHATLLAPTEQQRLLREELAAALSTYPLS